MHHPIRTPLTLNEFDCRIIVAGSRSFNDYTLFSRVMSAYLSKPAFKDKILCFISGDAREGADRMIIQWCKEHDYVCEKCPAKWSDIHVAGAVIRTNEDGSKYNVIAGHMRNQKMADIGTHLLAFWDKKSRGTKDMLRRAEKRGLVTQLVLVDADANDDLPEFDG